MEEKFVIPSVGAIIEMHDNNEKYILMQKRKKYNEKIEYGLWEIPAGKIREYENIYVALRREVKEETNLDITEIVDEDRTVCIDSLGYTITNVCPYNIIQNMSGGYSIIVLTFLCKASGEIICNPKENEGVQWRKIEEVRKELTEFPEKFYPMHLLTLKKYLKI